MKSPRFVRLFALFLAALVFTLAGVVLYVRIGLPGDKVARIAIGHLQASLGQHIVFSSARFSWLSATRARLLVADLGFSESAGRPVYLRIPRSVLEMDLLSLFKGKPVIDRAVFVSPAVLLTSGVTGCRQAIAGRGGFFGVRITSSSLPAIRHLEISDARVFSASTSTESTSPVLVLEKVGITAEEVTAWGVKNAAVRGRPAGGSAEAVFELGGHIDSTPLGNGQWSGKLSARFRKCPVSTLVTLASQLGFDAPFTGGECGLDLQAAFSAGKCRFEGGIGLSQAVCRPGRMYQQATVLENAYVQFNGTFHKDNLQLYVKRLELPGMTLSGELVADRVFSDNPVLAVTVSTAELDLERLFPIIPLNLIGEDDRRRLAQAGLKGRIELTELKWSGKVPDLLEGGIPTNRLLLCAELKGVSGFIPRAGLSISQAAGAVRLSEDLLSFKDFGLVLGGSPIELRGSVKALKSPAPRIDLFVSLNARANDLVPILTNRFVARRLPPWFKAVHDPSGRISLSLDLKGKLGAPTIRGRVELDGFSCGIDRLPLPVKNVKGSVRFRGSAVRLTNVRGTIGGSETEVSGDLSRNSLALAVAARLAPSDFKSLNLLPAGWRIGGRAPISIALSGKPSDVHFAFRADLNKNVIAMGSVFRKKSGNPLKLEAWGYHNSGGLTLEEAYVLIGKTRIAVKGTRKENGKVTLLVNLPPRGIQTQDLIPVLHPSLAMQPGGRIEGDISITTGTGLPGSLSLDANLDINHVSFHPWGFYRPWRGLTGTLRWRGESIDATIKRVKIGNSEACGSLSIRGFKTPHVDATLQFPYMETTDFTAPPDRADDTTWGEWIRSNYAIRFLARSRGKGRLVVKKGKTSARSFSAFEADFSGEGGFIKATNWRMSFAEGTLQGTAAFDIRANTNIPFALDFQADNVNMAGLLLTDPDKVSMQGNLVADGHMEWRTTRKRENAGIYKTGKIELRMGEGVIHRFEILSKIFSLINFGSILRGRLPDIGAQGLPFHRLAWRMDVFDTKWKVDDLKLYSDAARIDAAGMYFSDQGRIDFIVDVSPLVGLDTLVTGLFGNLLTRDGKILTTRFKVRGLSHSPDVRLEPLASFNGK